MRKIHVAALVALTILSTLAITQGVRHAVAQQQSTVCEDELADYQDEVKECLDKATTLPQARACADI
jgi:hypothetical protein